MLELKGKYNIAKVFTDNIDQTTMSQIIEVCNQDYVKDSKIRIMPDCHAGMGCVIGTTLTIKDKVVPNLVGVDIGCGMYTTKLGKVDINYKKLDDYIRQNIPHGFKINDHPQTDYKDAINNLVCFRDIPKSAKEFNRALGTLGGGNHFIEVNIDKEENKYLVIHSGSRNLGHQVASYYQRKAFDYHNGENEHFQKERKELIETYKEQGKRKEIQQALAKLKEKFKQDCKIPKELCYLEGQLMQDYLHDMKIVQQYSNINREVMAKRIIIEGLGMCLEYHGLESFQTIHNYINTKTMILRKGAISAEKGEKVLIPINMRDGSIIAIGKGNPDWNYSAPHGAGRLMSRTVAKENLNLEDFQETMKEVWSTSVRGSTLDEAPMAYKSIDDIVNNVEDTIEIIDVIKPLYNFKSS